MKHSVSINKANQQSHLTKNSFQLIKRELTFKNLKKNWPLKLKVKK